MSAGLIVVLAIVFVPYLAMNVVRLARGKRWAVTYCHALMEADRAAQARRRAERLSPPRSASPAAEVPRPRG